MAVSMSSVPSLPRSFDNEMLEPTSPTVDLLCHTLGYRGGGRASRGPQELNATNLVGWLVRVTK